MQPIVIYGTFGAWGIPSVSPFVLKLETWLRIAGLPYERRVGNPLSAPKGKVPYATFSQGGGERMGDSQLIIEALTTLHGVDLDVHLTPAQRATGHALRRMLEEATYFQTLRFRWVDDSGWPTQVAAFSPHMPPLVGPLILRMIRSKLTKTVQLQGSGRHDIGIAGRQVAGDIEALRALLVGPFLFGDTPSSFDATVSAFLWQCQEYPVDNPPRRAARTPELLAYVQAVRRRFWPELEMERITG